MDKKYTFLAIVLIAFFSLIPPINFFISAPMQYWPMIVLISAFLGIAFMFLKVNVVLRFIPIVVFLNCFFSAAPFISFTSLIAITACCYFYVICSKIERWDIVFKSLEAVVILVLIIVFMQFIGRDSLLNFGLNELRCFGTIGQPMQMASFAAVISAILILHRKVYIAFVLTISLFCGSAWGVFVFGVGIVSMLWFKNKRMAFIGSAICLLIFSFLTVRDNKIEENFMVSGRFPTWQKTIELSNQKPLTGFGVGTYKDIFPALSQLECLPYKTAHNCWLQILFEMGYPVFIAFVLLCGMFLMKLLAIKEYLCFSGALMIFSDMMIHFPTREIQCVLIIIAFIAYCETKIRAVKING